MSDGPPLARVAYDRAALRRTDDSWLRDAWERARIVAITAGSKAPIGPDGRVRFATAADPDVAAAATRRLLGVIDDVAYFTVTVPEEDGWKTLREAGAAMDDLEAALVVGAIGLEQWHQRHGHCPRCGAPAEERSAGWLRVCSADGSQHFPRTDPAVIMLIHDGDDLALLGRGHQWGEGRFSTLAGFVEPGESLEATVAREVFEEVGVHVRDVRYVASQPWPFPASLMVGFEARLDGDPTITLDPVEMADAAWFSRDEIRRAASWTDDIAVPQPGDPQVRLRAIPPHFSISRYLIDRWLGGDA